MTTEHGAKGAIAPLLFAPYTDGWTTKRWERIDRALRREWHSDGNIAEHDITALLSALNPPFESAVIQLLCRATGRPYSPDMRVYTMKVFLETTSSALDTRVPDFLVGRDHNDVVVPDIIVELKGNAWTNGGWKYCPRYGEDVYSNQVLCYLHGCWTSVDLRDVDFCWVGRRGIIDNPSHEFPWGNSAVNERDGSLNHGMRIAYRRHRIAALRWRPLTIEDIADVLRATTDGEVLADVIDAWCDHCSRSSPGSVSAR
ncbi:hypothetical protein ACIGO9_30605 [Nocardia asteroides]|uniref:hypothetical protein n=1 Tax=Nocardia asteroides TaxID=1824 RepID=UPI0037C70C3B